MGGGASLVKRGSNSRVQEFRIVQVPKQFSSRSLLREVEEETPREEIEEEQENNEKDSESTKEASDEEESVDSCSSEQDDSEGDSGCYELPHLTYNPNISKYRVGRSKSFRLCVPSLDSVANSET
jgi:hypothetical protein